MSLLPTLAFLGLLVLMAEGSDPYVVGGYGCHCSSYDYQTVCGYNGQTYHSPCYAQCAGVQVKHVGKCQSTSYYPGQYRYRSGCNCGQVSYSPVCCDNYATFDNNCLARCAGRRVLYAGKCRNDRAYPAGFHGAYSGDYRGAYARDYHRAYSGDYAAYPVNYGSTYYRTTACDLKCVGRNDRYPVCCSNARTYYNSCQARCAGANIFYYGECNRQVYYYNKRGQCGNCYRQARSFVCGRDGRTYYNQCSCDCASTDYYNYRQVGVSYNRYCNDFKYGALYY